MLDCGPVNWWAVEPPEVQVTWKLKFSLQRMFLCGKLVCSFHIQLHCSYSYVKPLLYTTVERLGGNPRCSANGGGRVDSNGEEQVDKATATAMPIFFSLSILLNFCPMCQNTKLNWINLTLCLCKPNFQQQYNILINFSCAASGALSWLRMTDNKK